MSLLWLIVLIFTVLLTGGCPHSKQTVVTIPSDTTKEEVAIPQAAPEPSPEKVTDTTADARVEQLLQAWWLKSTPIYGRAEDAWVADRLFAERQRVYDALKSYQHVSPLAKEVYATYYGHLSVGWLDSTKDLSIHQPGEEVRGKLIFVPLDQNPERFPMSIIYSEVVGGVVVHGYTIPDTLLAGIMFHELGHALWEDTGKHNVPLPLMDTDPNPDVFKRLTKEEQASIAQEEIEMHTLEATVFDAATKGAFGKFISDLVDQLGTSTTWSGAIQSVTAQQYEEVNAILGATAYPHLHSLLRPLVQLMVGIGWIDKQGWDKTKKDSEKINLFLYLRTGIAPTSP